MYLISSVETPSIKLELVFYFYAKKSTLTMELKSVTNDPLGLLIFEAPRWFVFWGTKNAADLEVYIFSRYLKDISIIYNGRVLHLWSKMLQ